MTLNPTAALILVVGENDACAPSVRILTAAGFNVIAVFNGSDALSKAHSENPELILIEGKLLDMDSSDLCFKLRNDVNLRGTLILQTYAAGQENAHLNDKRNGKADNYLCLPVTSEELIANVRVLLRLGVVERELSEADQRQDKFLMALAHELRNPLTPILNSVELLCRLDADVSTVHQKALSTIKRQVQYVVNILDDLLDVSQISQGKTWCDWEPVEAKVFINNAVAATAYIMAENNHTLSLGLPKQSIWIHGDQARLSQMISNLLLNAGKISKPGSELKLIANVVDQQLQLRLTNTSSAAVDEAMGESKLTINQAQLSMGLLLVRTLVELHGGYLRVYNASAGQGNIYEISLPIDMVASARFAVTPQTHKRILVVDDNADVADTLAQWLTLGGHSVQTAYTGADAITAATEFEPEIVLLDISLPDLNGFEVAKRLRELPNQKDFFVVAVTGYGHESAKKTYLERGFDEHFIKPMGIGKLRSIGINM
ncbi:MAG: response regulator [Pseudomonadota bacterium]